MRRFSLHSLPIICLLAAIFALSFSTGSVKAATTTANPTDKTPYCAVLLAPTSRDAKAASKQLNQGCFSSEADRSNTEATWASPAKTSTIRPQTTCGNIVITFYNNAFSGTSIQYLGSGDAGKGYYYINDMGSYWDYNVYSSVTNTCRDTQQYYFTGRNASSGVTPCESGGENYIMSSFFHHVQSWAICDYL